MIDPIELLARHSRPVPRYTSYPTAPHFSAGLGSELVSQQLAAAANAGAGAGAGGVSVYMHVPYCDRLCWFCGCHTRQTLKYAPVARYIDFLCAETALAGERMAALEAGGRPRLDKLHLGGGSPSMLTREDFARIRKALEGTFQFHAGSEISVEIDPSDEPGSMLDGLGEIGITRASIGVQDFDPEVQQAINRPQSFETTRDMVTSLRQRGVASVNIDALYGLPLQTMERITRTVEQVVELAPDRVALFGYAHVPWMKKHQQMIREEDLPGSVERFLQASRAEEILIDAGYVKIGIDHYALPGDELAIAASNGRLHRNFQGYTTDACETLIGFGASAIGRFADGYIQNIVPTGQYQAAVQSGALPAQRGYRLSEDDKVRAHVIERLMCDFAFDPAAVEARFGRHGAMLAEEAREIAREEREGLCLMRDGRFIIPEEARPFARIVAARFDAHLETGGFRYSKAV